MRPKFAEGGSRNDPQRNRYGCFRQDLTGLATTTSARLPVAHMAKRSRGIKSLSHGPVPRRTIVSTIGIETLALRPVPGAHPATGHARTAIAMTPPAGTTIPARPTVPAGTAIPTRTPMVPAGPAIPAGATAPAVVRSRFGRGGDGDTRHGDQTGADDSKKFHDALLPKIPPLGEHGRRMANRR